MNKNIPNMLTMFRVICIPIFIILFTLDFRYIAGLVFVIASITDYFDGKIARKYNLVTNFGKLMDPLADKMIVITALILLSSKNEINYIFTLIVVLRELTISSIRLIALEQGNVIAASYYGKFKTASQMVALILFLFNIHTLNYAFYIITKIVFYISMFFVIVSLVDYIIKNKKVFKN